VLLHRLGSMHADEFGDDMKEQLYALQSGRDVKALVFRRVGTFFATAKEHAPNSVLVENVGIASAPGAFPLGRQAHLR